MKIYNLPTKKNYRVALRKSATPQEVRLWSRIRRVQLGVKFRRQHSIGKYIVDFYAAEKKIIIELDGSGHKAEESVQYDEARDAYLRGLGHKVLRFDNIDVDKDIDAVVLEIENQLAETS